MSLLIITLSKYNRKNLIIDKLKKIKEIYAKYKKASGILFKNDGAL